MSTLAAYSASQPRTLTRVLKAEINPNFTRRDATLLAGSGASRDVVIGEVAGRRIFGTAAGAVVKGAGVGGGTGDGGLGSITKGASVKVGVYALKCIAEAGNAGTFSVTDPEGYRLPDATVGVAYAHPQINFTISDGANDFDLTDAFSITIPVGDLKVVAISFAAVDGSQRWAGIFSKNTCADAACGPHGSPCGAGTDLAGRRHGRPEGHRACSGFGQSHRGRAARLTFLHRYIP